MNGRHESRRTLRAAIAFALTYLMVWGGVPAPAFAEMVEEAMTEETQTSATKPQEQELGTEGGAGNVEPQVPEPQTPPVQEPQLTVQGDQPSETITVESEPVTLSMEGGQSNEELLNAYVQHKLDEPLEQSAGVQLGVQSAADGLEGINATAYAQLKPLVSKIAAGQLESSKFSIPLDKLRNCNVITCTS